MARLDAQKADTKAGDQEQVGSGKWEVGSGKWEVKDQDSEKIQTYTKVKVDEWFKRMRTIVADEPIELSWACMAPQILPAQTTWGWLC